MSISIPANLSYLRNAHPQLDRIRCVQLCQCFNPLRTKSDGVAKSDSTTAKANYEARLGGNLESRQNLRGGTLGRWGVWMVGLRDLK